MTSGTPEGGLLSPLMFAMFINDLPARLNSRSLMFADDVKIFRKISSSSDAVALQDDLNQLCRWSHSWKLQLNPTKCKSFRMTLKKLPVQTTYFVGNTALEHVDTIRDLGVILDEKLTFAPHVDSIVKKANKFLGLLIRSFQKARGERGAGGGIDLSSVRASYCAHVRSVLEYCSVIWAGAAQVHLNRVERVQHKYLMWLNAIGLRQRACDSLAYEDLLLHHRTASIKARILQHDIMFCFKVHRGMINSSILLNAFPLHVPARRGRMYQLLSVPYARVNTVKEGLFGRLPRAVNEFLRNSPQTDMFHEPAASFKSSVIRYVRVL